MPMQLFSAIQYLHIDIANNFGHDKEDWDFRLSWFENHKADLPSLLAEAKEPALFYAGVQAYEKAMRGEVNTYPISLDATASGIQLLSCLAGCRQSALLCNVVDAGRRMDAYTALYDMMCARIGEASKIARKDTKNAIMTAFYQSKAVPREVFGDGPLLVNFYDTVAEEAPGAWALNESFAGMWNPEALSNDWVLPDGFHVHIPVMNTITEKVHFLNQPFDVSRKVNMPSSEGRSLGANSNHSVDGMVVREMNRRCNYDPERIARLRTEVISNNVSVNRPRDRKVIELWDYFEKSGFLSARIFDYLDHDNAGHVDTGIMIELINTLPPKPFQVLTVHQWWT